MTSLIGDIVATIPPIDQDAMAATWARQHDLTKPRGSLGALEQLAARLAGSTGQVAPVLEPAAVVVFAGDHGVHAQGVSRWPQVVTGQMVSAVLAGGAAVSVFARRAGAHLRVVDVGTAHPAETAHPDLRRRPIGPGTADFTAAQAMTREQAELAVETGIEAAAELIDEGHRLLAAGDLGIANTTASAALVCAFTGEPAADATGRGTGLDDTEWLHKVDVVQATLDLHRPDAADPIGVLAAVGGFEHAAITGFLLGAASRRVPVVLDGVITCSAALAAQSLSPYAVAHWVAGHRSQEPGATLALAQLGLEPVLDLEMRLGEGTGAVLAMPVVQAAVDVLRDMATFSGAGIDDATAATPAGTPGAAP